MYLGIDVHKRYAQVAVMDEAGKIVEEVRVENANLDDLAQQYAGSQAVLEATSNYYHIHDTLSKHLDVTVADPKKTNLNAPNNDTEKRSRKPMPRTDGRTRITYHTHRTVRRGCTGTRSPSSSRRFGKQIGNGAGRWTDECGTSSPIWGPEGNTQLGRSGTPADNRSVHRRSHTSG